MTTGRINQVATFPPRPCGRVHVGTRHPERCLSPPEFIETHSNLVTVGPAFHLSTYSTGLRTSLDLLVPTISQVSGMLLLVHGHRSHPSKGTTGDGLHPQRGARHRGGSPSNRPHQVWPSARSPHLSPSPTDASNERLRTRFRPFTPPGAPFSSQRRSHDELRL